MKSLKIWWHRRRAAHHNAMKHRGKSGWYYHLEWAGWHLEQLKRIEGEK